MRVAARQLEAPPHRRNRRRRLIFHIQKIIIFILIITRQQRHQQQRQPVGQPARSAEWRGLSLPRERTIARARKDEAFDGRRNNGRALFFNEPALAKRSSDEKKIACAIFFKSSFFS